MIVYIFLAIVILLLLLTMDHAAGTRKRLEVVEERLEDVEDVLAELKQESEEKDANNNAS